MIKHLLAGAAALAVAGIAIAQTAPASGPQHMAMKAMTRAEMSQMVQQHFARLDSNRDGVVTKAEMDAAKATRHAKRADRRFDRLDSNDDGSVTKSEFEAAHKGMDGHRMGMRGMHHGAMGARMFGMADSNKDGQVTLTEATAAALAHFDAADANHDGTLTPEEMHAAHKAMRASRS